MADTRRIFSTLNDSNELFAIDQIKQAQNICQQLTTLEKNLEEEISALQEKAKRIEQLSTADATYLIDLQENLRSFRSLNYSLKGASRLLKTKTILYADSADQLVADVKDFIKERQAIQVKIDNLLSILESKGANILVLYDDMASKSTPHSNNLKQTEKLVEEFEKFQISTAIKTKPVVPSAQTGLLAQATRRIRAHAIALGLTVPSDPEQRIEHAREQRNQLRNFGNQFSSCRPNAS